MYYLVFSGLNLHDKRNDDDRMKARWATFRVYMRVARPGHMAQNPHVLPSLVGLGLGFVSPNSVVACWCRKWGSSVSANALVASMQVRFKVT